MAGSTFHEEKVINFPLNQVWQVLHATASLDIMGGQKVINKESASEWETTDGDGHTIHCISSFDDATHTVTIEEHSTAKHQVDTTVIHAEDAGDNTTKVAIDATVNVGIDLLAAGLLKLLGGHAYDSIAKTVLANIEALCEHQDTHQLSQQEMTDWAKGRVAELGKK